MNKFKLLRAFFLLAATALYSFSVQEDIVVKGAELVGSPYRYGGTNPSGFDCSGLVNYLYKPHISSLPRTASQLSLYGSTVPLYEITRGDLVFYATGQNRNEITHVGIYIGQNTLIQAVSAGPERGVILTDLDERYWSDRYKWTKRVLPREIGEVVEKIDMDFSKGTYRGSATGNEPEGEGRMVMGNGDVYTGQFHRGLFHGPGEYRYSNGDIYVGEFENGRESGGVIVKSDGLKYSAGRDSRGILVINNRAETKGSRTNFLLEPASSWDDWLSREVEGFEASKRADQEGVKSEMERFEEWKKTN